MHYFILFVVIDSVVSYSASKMEVKKYNKKIGPRNPFQAQFSHAQMIKIVHIPFDIFRMSAMKFQCTVRQNHALNFYYFSKQLSHFAAQNVHVHYR